MKIKKYKQKQKKTESLLMVVAIDETLTPILLVSDISFTDFGKSSPNSSFVTGIRELHSCLI